MKRKVGLWVMCFCLAMALSACEKKTTEEPIVAESNFVTEEETKQSTEAQKAESKENTHKEKYEELTFCFADAKEGADFLSGNKEYLNGLTQNDLNFRMHQKDTTLEEYIAFATKQTLDFTEEEKEVVSAGMEKIKDICEKNSYKLPAVEEITFVKTTMLEESGAGAYTHDTQIYISKSILSLLGSEDRWAQDYGTAVLAHELFHCLTRNDAQFRKDMYGILGFRVQEEEFQFAPAVRERILSNPDVGKYNSYATFQIGGKERDCVVVFTTTLPFQNPGDDMFELMTAGLVPIDDLSVMYPAESASNFWTVFGRNTEYVIDPEEVLADNFSYAIIYGVDGMDYKSPEIIREICEYLKK